MSDLRLGEKLALEEALGMASGYVGSFSDRTFQEFIYEAVGRDIDEPGLYEGQGTSKAKRLREFWRLEPNHVVASLLEAMSTQWRHVRGFGLPAEPPSALLEVASRLRSDNDAAQVEQVLLVDSHPDFEVLARAIRDAVDQGRYVEALDRLHTFLVRFFRDLCQTHEIEVDDGAPLHSLSGAYGRKLREEGIVESRMTLAILKENTKVLQAFNDVRNHQTYAHANDVLNPNESELIVAHVIATVRFIRGLERDLDQRPQLQPAAAAPRESTVPPGEEDLPF